MRQDFFCKFQEKFDWRFLGEFFQDFNDISLEKKDSQLLYKQQDPSENSKMMRKKGNAQSFKPTYISLARY